VVPHSWAEINRARACAWGLEVRVEDGDGDASDWSVIRVIKKHGVVVSRDLIAQCARQSNLNVCHSLIKPLKTLRSDKGR
jgi:hypothetical protein